MHEHTSLFSSVLGLGSVVGGKIPPILVWASVPLFFYFYWFGFAERWGYGASIYEGWKVSATCAIVLTSGAIVARTFGGQHDGLLFLSVAFIGTIILLTALAGFLEFIMRVLLSVHNSKIPRKLPSS